MYFCRKWALGWSHRKITAQISKVDPTMKLKHTINYEQQL